MKGKKICKSRDKVICGVAGGIAEYLGIDPFWMRLVFVFFSLSGGAGVLVYIIAALLMDEPSDIVS